MGTECSPTAYMMKVVDEMFKFTIQQGLKKQFSSNQKSTENENITCNRHAQPPVGKTPI